MKNINPTHTTAWKALLNHFNLMKDVKISELFIMDKQRFSNFSITFDNQMLVDFSKNYISSETLVKLQNLAKECGLEQAIHSMFNGEKINYSEDRAVLHIALRNRSNTPIIVDGKNVMLEINTVLDKMKNFCELVISGSWKGYTGRSITDIVNIGVGGSSLGSYMVTEALRPYKNHLNLHFISNIDSTHIVETLKNLKPDTTLFLISSKTFTTQETMSNAYSARNWFLKIANKKQYIFRHFIALSANINAAVQFGISIKNVFKLWNWVNGRYSLWSAIGLPIALSLGFDNFKKLLDGAHSMDNHFMKTPFTQNIPIILALISIWYNNFFGIETEAILLYDQYLHNFSTYFQQVYMESNGKYIDRNGKYINYQTGSIIWGGLGINGQHSFYQLLHQGTKIVPCDFIAPINTHNPLTDHHVKLLSNFFAQTKALAFGELCYEINEKTKLFNKNSEPFQKSPFKTFKGNRPSNSILLQKITPYSLGALIALYEHKIFTQGVIFNIHVFDQWGVELGKQLASKILPELSVKNKTVVHDSSTNGLINYYKMWSN